MGNDKTCDCQGMNIVPLFSRYIITPHARRQVYAATLHSVTLQQPRVTVNPNIQEDRKSKSVLQAEQW